MKKRSRLLLSAVLALTLAVFVFPSSVNAEQYEHGGYIVTISLNPEKGGSVSYNPVSDGGVALSVTTKPDYIFTGWTIDGEQGPTDTELYRDIYGDTTFVANFAQAYEISATASPPEGGTVTGAGKYKQEDIVKLEANPNEGWLFRCWSEGTSIVSTNSPYSFNALRSRTLVAEFYRPVTIGAKTSDSTKGYVTGGGTFDPGVVTSVTLKAMPLEGYEFCFWLEDGNDVSHEAEYEFTLTENRTLVAYFDKKMVEAKFVNWDQKELGSLTVEYGSVLEYSGETPVRQPDDEYTYTFKGWSPELKEIYVNTTYTAQYRSEKIVPVYTVTEGADGTWTSGSGQAYRITVKRDPADDRCFGFFAGVLIDGEELEDGYTADSGSTVVTLAAETLEDLSGGRHTVTVSFEDGTAETSLTVKKDDTSVPPTDDAGAVPVWAAIAVSSIIGLCALIIRKKEEI